MSVCALPILLYKLCCQYLLRNAKCESQGPHSHSLMTGGVRQRFIFYTPKNPEFRICLPPKISTFFSIPKKIPQCFCISKFYYLSSGKVKHANFNFGFSQKNCTKTNTKSSHDCYSVSSSYLLRQLYRKIFIMTSTACLVLSTFFACYCTETSLCNRPRGIRLFTMFLCN